MEASISSPTFISGDGKNCDTLFSELLRYSWYFLTPAWTAIGSLFSLVGTMQL